MKKQNKYIIKFINAKNQDGTVWYTIQVFNAKDDQSWTFRQRYSHMRDIHQKCMQTNKKNDLPQFPHKKLFGNTKQDFIQKRKKQLENYYNTLLTSSNIDIQTQLPELLQFFNTNKPKKQKKSSLPQKQSQINQQKDLKSEINKQIQLRKKFDQIARQTEERLVECDDFNNQQIDDETRKKYNNEFQKLKIQYKSQIISAIQDQDKLKIKGTKDIEDCWAFQLKDHYENNFKKLQKLSKMVNNIQNQSYLKSTFQKKPLNFVIVF